MRRSKVASVLLVTTLALLAVFAAGDVAGENRASIGALAAKIKARDPLRQRQVPRLASQQRRGKHTLASSLHVRGGREYVQRPRTARLETAQAVKQNGFQRAYNAYSRALEERPLFTKIWSAAVVSAIGNLLAQAIAADVPIWSFHIDDVNFEELITYTLVGAFYFAPLTHYWFHKLAQLIERAPQLKNASGMTKATAMMLVDQTVGAVAVNAGFLLLYGVIDRVKDMDLVMNEPPSVTILRRLKQSLWALLLMNWCVWPAANLINFYAVPYRFRVLYTNVVGALWSIYLSSIVSSNSK